MSESCVIIRICSGSHFSLCPFGATPTSPSILIPLLFPIYLTLLTRELALTWIWIFYLFFCPQGAILFATEVHAGHTHSKNNAQVHKYIHIIHNSHGLHHDRWAVRHETQVHQFIIYSMCNGSSAHSFF